MTRQTLPNKHKYAKASSNLANFAARQPSYMLAKPMVRSRRSV